MNLENCRVTPGKVHRQLDGDDTQTYTLTGTVGGRKLALSVILPAGTAAESAIARELEGRAARLVESFRHTPFAIEYDGITEDAGPGALAAGHTAGQLAEAAP